MEKAGDKTPEQKAGDKALSVSVDKKTEKMPGNEKPAADKAALMRQSNEKQLKENTPSGKQQQQQQKEIDNLSPKMAPKLQQHERKTPTKILNDNPIIIGNPDTTPPTGLSSKSGPTVGSGTNVTVKNVEIAAGGQAMTMTTTTMTMTKKTKTKPVKVKVAPLPRPKMIVMRYTGVIVPKDTWKTQFYDFIQRDFPYFVKRNYDEYEEYFLRMADENAYYASIYAENDLSFVVTTIDVCLADSLPIWAIFCLQHFDIFEESFMNEFPITSKLFSESIIIGMLEGNFRLDVPETVVKFLRDKSEESIPIVMLSNFTHYFHDEKQLTILKYTMFGDITGYFVQFIDPEKEGMDLKTKEFYLEFVSKYGLEPEDVMFITGNPAEIKKSARAGLCVVSTTVSNVNEKYKNIVYTEEIGEIEFFN